ncbi:MAG: sirohydrochlorin cobaltochelatase [Bacteroidaceae bacterium]|nr:sirohydrochlorin cobaltochelatase [Bacteroidaceae bacterium]
MKKICLFAILLCVSIITFAQADKTAILMVHFGTTEPEGRTLSLETVNNDVKAAFPDMEVRQAYASAIIRNIWGKRGERIYSPQEALMQLRADGYEHVYVQSTTLMEGYEMTYLRETIASLRPFFKELVAGNPLLYSVEDCKEVLRILSVDAAAKNQSVVLVGHGTTHPSTAVYAMMQTMLQETGQNNWYVSTIEGYPTQDMTLKKLKQDKVKKVELRPLLLTAGDHARNDIAKEWKELFEQQGFEVSIKLQGLGEFKAIRDIYIQHIKNMLK